MIAPPRPPSHDELEALIREARARQLRRRLLAAAGVAIAAALGLSLYALTTSGRAGGVTPANAGRPNAPPCSASQLSTTVSFQGATQTMLGGASIANTSDSACSLPSGRPVVRISWRGRRMPIREQPGPGSIGPSFHPAHVLAPGAQAEVIMQWRAKWYCGTGPERTNFSPRFQLHLSRSLLVVATADGMIQPNCGKAVTSYLGVTRPLADT